jgi:hypothetical protein
MIASDRFYRKPGFWQGATIAAIALLFVLSFWSEIKSLWLVFRGSFPVTQPLPPDLVTPVVAFLNFIKFLGLGGIFLGVALFAVAQFVLPVETSDERQQVFWRLVYYLSGWHGPAVFIREGKQVARPEEMSSVRPGVAFVDLSSAVVLEKQWKPEEGERVARVGGPGIVFTEVGERIHGIVDLRKQFRINLNVPARTGDGIELTGHVICIFTLGQPPDVLKVAYAGDEKAENIRVVQVDQKTVREPQSPLGYRTIQVIKSLSDELDEADKAEIHRFASERRAMHQFIQDDLAPLDRDLIQNFAASLRPANFAFVRSFIDRLFADERAALHAFIDRLAPSERTGIYRFVIDKAACLDFVTFLYTAIEKALSHEHQQAEAQIRAENMDSRTAEAQKLRALQAETEARRRALRAEQGVAYRFVDGLFGRYRKSAARFVGGLDTPSQERIGRFVGRFCPNLPPEKPAPQKPWRYTPYTFDEKRVFAAIYSKGRNARVSNLQGWSELPTLAATEAFRNIISQYKYDDFYQPEDPKKYPVLQEIKPRFSRTVRYQGMLAYQVIRRRDGQKPAAGDEINAAQYVLDCPAQELQNSKVLRDRGIKVLVGTFSELRPANPLVRQQRFETWQARWQKEDELIRADHDLEVMRIRSRARAQAQRDMTYALSQIFRSAPHTQEAMAVRVFQALETAAADPATRKLLPRDTINMLRSLRYWLLPGEEPPILPDDLTPEKPPVDERSANAGGAQP